MQQRLFQSPQAAQTVKRQFGFLCAYSVVLCVSVVGTCLRKFTTETQRSTEFHRVSSSSELPRAG